MQESTDLSITVRTISSPDYILSYPATATIGEFKKHLAARHPLLKDHQPPACFRLIAAGRLLSDTSSLCHIPKIPGSQTSIIVHMITPFVPSTSVASANKSDQPGTSPRTSSPPAVPSHPTAQSSPSAWPFALPYQLVFINGFPYAMAPAYPVTTPHSNTISNVGLMPIQHPFGTSSTQTQQPFLPQNNQSTPTYPPPAQPLPQHQPAHPNNGVFVDDEFGEPVQGNPQSWWWLLLRLGFVLFMFGEHLSASRMVTLCATAAIIFLSQMGWFRMPRIHGFQRNPFQQEPRPLEIGGGPTPAGNNNNSNNVNVDGAAPVAQVPMADYNSGVLGLAAQVIFRLLTSLIPTEAA
ncbi:hypothetical protein SeMB42_g00163 [Synchytrium endobioticum]|uniref:Ubiquitin-like domain-containing protein n=1 Tax=Synchytrium endobioticum TaxID=286115 RepID=A0A507DUN3_9FUNG|nr:hypothetical protein SeMB42_g00163 [Synchytrium endobioticum]